MCIYVSFNTYVYMYIPLYIQACKECILVCDVQYIAVFDSLPMHGVRVTAQHYSAMLLTYTNNDMKEKADEIRKLAEYVFIHL